MKQLTFATLCVAVFVMLSACSTIDDKLFEVGQHIKSTVCPQPLDARLLFRKKAWDMMQLDTSYVCQDLMREEKDSLWVDIRRR